jgi:hypothetical protein
VDGNMDGKSLKRKETGQHPLTSALVDYFPIIYLIPTKAELLVVLFSSSIHTHIPHNKDLLCACS